MALASLVTGTGNLVSSDATVRVVRYYGAADITVYTRKQAIKVWEWVALTQACADGAVDTSSQADLPAGAVAVYSASEDNRVVGSYRLTKTINYAQVLTTDTEEYPA